MSRTVPARLHENKCYKIVTELLRNCYEEKRRGSDVSRRVRFQWHPSRRLNLVAPCAQGLLVAVVVLDVSRRKGFGRKTDANRVRSIIELVPLFRLAAFANTAHQVQMPKEQSKQEKGEHDCAKPGQNRPRAADNGVGDNSGSRCLGRVTRAGEGRSHIGHCVPNRYNILVRRSIHFPARHRRCLPTPSHFCTLVATYGRCLPALTL
jgi:hypothetical protein